MTTKQQSSAVDNKRKLHQQMEAIAERVEYDCFAILETAEKNSESKRRKTLDPIQVKLREAQEQLDVFANEMDKGMKQSEKRHNTLARSLAKECISLDALQAKVLQLDRSTAIAKVAKEASNELKNAVSFFLLCYCICLQHSQFSI